MTFEWPVVLPLLLVLPAIVAAYLLALRRRRPTGLRYSSVSLVRAAVPSSSRLRRHLPFGLFVAAVGLLVLAMARPAITVAVPSNQTTIILALDVSGSMCSGDVPPNRLLAAEAAAASFIDQQAADTQIGIVAFSGFAEVVQAPTSDRSRLLDALRSLVTGRRTAIGSGILASIDAISQVDPAVPPSVTDSRPGTEPPTPPAGSYQPDVVVLLTDGANNAGPEPLDAAQQAADRGIRVYTVGFGTAEGGAFSAQCPRQLIGNEPNGFGGFGGFGGGGGGFGGGGGGGGGFRRGIDEDTLKAVAASTGGTYHPAESASELQGVLSDLPTHLILKTEAAEVSVVAVALAAIVAALAFLLGRAWRPLP